MPRQLRVPQQLEEAMLWSVELIGLWAGIEHYRMGGGTVLAMRWNHRFSTDIDFFMDPGATLELYRRGTWDDLLRQLETLQAEGVVRDLLTTTTGFSLHGPTAPLSLFEARRLTVDAVSDEREAASGVALESSLEIMLKKVRARMLRSPRYLARDMYDLVACFIDDKQTYDNLFHALTQRERQSLLYDIERGDTRVLDLNRIIEPKYPQILESLDRFTHFANEVLSGRPSRPVVDELLEIKAMQTNHRPRQ